MRTLVADLQQGEASHADEGRHVGPRRRVVREQPDRGSRAAGKGVSQAQDGQRTPQVPRVDLDGHLGHVGHLAQVGSRAAGGDVRAVGRHHRLPISARTAATACGSAALSAATSASRLGLTAARGSVIRMLPWVSAPIAAST